MRFSTYGVLVRFDWGLGGVMMSAQNSIDPLNHS